MSDEDFDWDPAASTDSLREAISKRARPRVRLYCDDVPGHSEQHCCYSCHEDDELYGGMYSLLDTERDGRDWTLCCKARALFDLLTAEQLAAIPNETRAFDD